MLWQSYCCYFKFSNGLKKYHVYPHTSDEWGQQLTRFMLFHSSDDSYGYSFSSDSRVLAIERLNIKTGTSPTKIIASAAPEDSASRSSDANL